MSKPVTQRAKIKAELLKRRGGKCKACGYSKSVSALRFHHRDPLTKYFNISGVLLTTMSRQLLEAEADKCDVYCLNCYSELYGEAAACNDHSLPPLAPSGIR
jgi:predicted nucleic-acid-binding Zn-ribbon protein